MCHSAPEHRLIQQPSFMHITPDVTDSLLHVLCQMLHSYHVTETSASVWRDRWRRNAILRHKGHHLKAGPSLGFFFFVKFLHSLRLDWDATKQERISSQPGARIEVMPCIYYVASEEGPERRRKSRNVQKRRKKGTEETHPSLLRPRPPPSPDLLPSPLLPSSAASAVIFRECFLESR